MNTVNTIPVTDSHGYTWEQILKREGVYIASNKERLVTVAYNEKYVTLYVNCSCIQPASTTRWKDSVLVSTEENVSMVFTKKG